MSITFTNRSTGSISSYSWDFDEGPSSSAKSPTHVFPSERTYLVILTVSGPGGTDVAQTTITVPCP
jgi:PKD repeat protein